MLHETGIVQSVDNDLVWVKTRRKSACGHCGHRDHCQMIQGTDQLLIKAQNEAKAVEGDEVELYLSTKKKLWCVFLVYMVPVLGLIAGAFIGKGLSGLFGFSSEVLTILFSIAGLLSTLYPLRRYSNRLDSQNSIVPLVKRILKHVDS